MYNGTDIQRHRFPLGLPLSIPLAAATDLHIIQEQRRYHPPHTPGILSSKTPGQILRVPDPGVLPLFLRVDYQLQCKVVHEIYLQYALAAPKIRHSKKGSRPKISDIADRTTHISPTTSGGQITLVSGLTMARVASAIGYPNPPTRTIP